MISLSPIDIGILIIYFLALFGIAVYFRKTASTTVEYFLAGRRLTLPLFVLTLVSTWYGGTLGVVEYAFSYGIVNWLTQGFFWYTSYLIFAFFLAKKIRKSQLYTIPDQLEKMYDKKSRVLGAIINFIMLSPAPYLLSLGLISSLLFNIPIGISLLIVVGIMLLYTIRGGFSGILYTDILQFGLMYIGVIVLLGVSVFTFGGWEYLTVNLPETHLTLTGTWTWQMILVWGFMACWTFVSPNFYQRCYATKNDSIPKKGILISILFWMIFDVCTTGIGLYAAASMPGIDAATSLPLYAAEMLPPVVLGLFFAGLIASIMSTADSFSFASAMNLSHDLYKNVFKKDASEKQVIRATQWSLVITFVIAFFIALLFATNLENNYGTIMGIIYAIGTIGVSALLVPILLGFFGPKNIPPASSWISMICAIFASTSWLTYGYMNLDEYGWPAYIWGIEPMYAGILASLISFLVVWAVQCERKS